MRAAAKGLMEANILAEFHTAIASFPGSIIDKLGAIGLFAEIRRRRFDPSLQSITLTSPFFEAGRIISSKIGLSQLIKHESGIFSIDAVYKNIDKKVAARIQFLSEKGVKGVYAFEDGALLSFIEAKRYGLKCFYDLPIGYWRTARKLLEVEKERWPEWASTLTGFKDSETKLERKDQEIQLADVIFAASQFTANTLSAFPGTLPPVKIIPYAFPPVNTQKEYAVIQGKRRIKLLFVGGLSQRKGIADLFAAVQRLETYVELTVVGLKATSDCAALNAALQKHHWIPTMPHHEILKLMREYDVLIFPSLFEGFGLVITEAMSQGTPVITTDRTAGPDLIKHGENGWLIQAGSTQALKNAIDNLIQNPSQIAEAGSKAIETARLRTWKMYGEELANAVKEYLM